MRIYPEGFDGLNLACEKEEHGWRPKITCEKHEVDDLTLIDLEMKKLHKNKKANK